MIMNHLLFPKRFISNLKEFLVFKVRALFRKARCDDGDRPSAVPYVCLCHEYCWSAKIINWVSQFDSCIKIITSLSCSQIRNQIKALCLMENMWHRLFVILTVPAWYCGVMTMQARFCRFPSLSQSILKWQLSLESNDMPSTLPNFGCTIVHLSILIRFEWIICT